MLEQGVLKRLAGQHCGHTLTTIMRGLELTTDAGDVTWKGKAFCLDAFSANKCDYGGHDALSEGGERADAWGPIPPLRRAVDVHGAVPNLLGDVAIPPCTAPESGRGQYRLLKVGDTIHRGDEALQPDTVTWVPVHGWSFGMAYAPGPLQLPHRRPLPPSRG
jgi:hypothetical protein